MTFDQLEKKGNELAARRDATANKGERELLNKEIRAIRNKQIELLKAELIKGLSVAVPEMVKQAIQSSSVVAEIERLQRGE